MEITIDQALQKGVESHKAGKLLEADQYYTAILKTQPNHPDANHNMGVLAVGVGKVPEALPFFKTALEANPRITQFWLSYIDALIQLNRMDDARALLNRAKSNGAKRDGFEQIEKRLSREDNIAKTQEPSQDQLQTLITLYTNAQYEEALTEATKLLTMFPDSINLYNIIGVANQNLGKLEQAIQAYQKALSIKPDFAQAQNNMGNTLKDQGKLEEAIKAFQKALSINPDFAEAHYNLGNILKDQGKLEEATEAYRKAISLKPNNTEAHLSLSSVTNYTIDDDHFVQVKKLYKQSNLNKDDRCNLSFALAKIYDDIGDTDKSFTYLTKGNALRKKLLNYSINNDKNFFINLKKTQPYLLKNSITIEQYSIGLSPIFILGMPRSGTTLVEQIISSHPKVTGAGELNSVQQMGLRLAIGSIPINRAAVSEFRARYLSELSKLSNGRPWITDKMPQNFRFIPLICAAFPEAKIVHVHRNAAATCWSNYKQFFFSKDLGYSNSLEDIVSYYKLYHDLMNFWEAKYGDQIYHLNYENLTTDQENQSRKLIKHIGLSWEKACLSPHENKRSVRTASQQQVRQKVYQGSSETWRKYEPFLNGAFDGLPAS